MPDVGRNAARQPHWAAYNLLFHSALPPFAGEASDTREAPAQVPAVGRVEDCKAAIGVVRLVSSRPRNVRQLVALQLPSTHQQGAPVSW